VVLDEALVESPQDQLRLCRDPPRYITPKILTVVVVVGEDPHVAVAREPLDCAEIAGQVECRGDRRVPRTVGPRGEPDRGASSRVRAAAPLLRHRCPGPRVIATRCRNLTP